MPKHLLFAVLNWGLGHATRSTPLITTLLHKGFKVTIAANGLSLTYLKNQFPTLPYVELDSPEVIYGKGSNQILALVKKSGSYAKWYQTERRLVKDLLKKEDFSGIISDNRPTVFSNKIPSVYITHQVHIKAGLLSKPASLIHDKTFHHYNEIWVPDFEQSPGLSADLGHAEINTQKRFIGPLSALSNIKERQHLFDVGIILSGPEPQRTLLENALVHQLRTSELRIKLIRGTQKETDIKIPEHWQVIHLGSQHQVQETFEESEVIIARNGYSTLMDLATFPKPALLIPTPGQPEQEYLAKIPVHLEMYAIQKQRKLDVLDGLNEAKAKFPNQHNTDFKPDWEKLFSIF